tara:strand:- start:86 stop:382 length:297 start_codon:yes stop_codon:yes gene_type:complete
MALDPIGSSLKIKELKSRLEKRFPNFNFDVKQEFDTKHKSPSLCKSNTINYTDMEGNLFCGQRFKLQSDKNPFSYEWATCHALIKKAEVKDNSKELPF